MLGVSQSGKTCFIYAMYDFMQQSQSGFTFITNDPDVDMDLCDGWAQIAYDGVWPNGTELTSHYDFSVLFHSKKIMEFSWCDYRGGAVSGRSTENEDVTELQKRIKESECLIICLGADTVKALLSGDMRKQRELRTLNQHLSRFALENPERRVPVIFALTKSDLYTAEEQPKLLGLIKSYFSSLYDEGANWLFAIVPVTLGIFNSTEGTKINGTIAPKNIHIPVMFFLHSLLKERIRSIHEQMQGIKIDRKSTQQQLTIQKGKSWWERIWNGDQTSSLTDKVSNLDAEEMNLVSLEKELSEAFGTMKDMFKVCKVFYNGLPVEFN